MSYLHLRGRSVIDLLINGLHTHTGVFMRRSRQVLWECGFLPSLSAQDVKPHSSEGMWRGCHSILSPSCHFF